MKSVDQINFQPLENYTHASSMALKKVIKNLRSMLIIASAFLLALLSLAFGARPSDLHLLPIFVVIYFIGKEASNLQDSMWLDFTLANGWTLDLNDVGDTFVPKSLAVIGQDHKTSPIVVAEINNKIWHILEHQYSEGSGRSRRDYVHTIVRVKLPKILPYIALDSKKNSGGLRVFPHATHKVKLEGDFNDYFTLHFQNGASSDVLSIISPDVMQTLIDSSQQEDIEIIDDNIYFIGVKDRRDSSQLKALLQSAEKVLTEIDHRLKSLQYKHGIVASTGQIRYSISESNVQYNQGYTPALRLILTIIFVLLMLVLAVMTVLGPALGII